ncbi:MAG TPA: ImmA/IrrE family metallo-endopeptidase [Bradyrhizobium sp.]|uniref:ImmA/IrrE family metallo-endopeptidase n=1 Tax=Bradyrhizobium sp. TaxID=376 RepID=UPI002CA8C66B|nr:ImmA/IrrE family metallo-endopeptidase [Bradyrhizobium sp.]HLZ00958.1 ImmA/IrrE family metallo-endopeptidase [Bradyrhizobium sp.]
MIIKPIRNSGDLKRAKAHLATLVTENIEGRHDDDIEVLSTLVEKYEDSFSRIDAPTPIAAIKYRMDELGLTPRGLEPFIGSRARVSEVLSGKRHLSIDMIRSLHEGLRIPYESLFSERPRNIGIEHVSEPALDKLNALGFSLERNNLRSFIPSSLHQGAPLALLRKTRTQRTSSKTDQSALMLWQAAVLQKCEEATERMPFDINELRATDFRRLARLSTHSDGPLRATKMLSGLGVCVTVLPPLPGTFLDGAAMVSAYGVPVIGLTLRFDRVDSFWFTLLHEVAHIALHYDFLMQNREPFIDDMEIRSDDMQEREADEFARKSLIPDHFLGQVEWSAASSHDDLVAVATRARVHVAIVAGRWQRDHQNYKKFSRLIERDTLRPMLQGV